MNVESLWRRLLLTEDDPVLAALRVALGAVILPHGAQKLFGWFGGYGFAGTMDYFTSTVGVAAPLGVLAILAESVGGIALLAGIFSRPAALGVGAVMVVAALTVHRPYGFFIDWFGTQGGQGVEYFVAMGALAAVVVAKGGGRWSLDRALTRPAPAPAPAPRPA
jgi:putative oxidoreductase